MKNVKNIKGLQSIGDIMPAALKKFDAGRNLGKYSIIINWEKIVGKEIAGNTFVSNIDRGKLIIKVKNSVWSHHLLMLKEEMMRKINGYLGKNLITDIWFMAGYDKDKQNYKSIDVAIEERLINPVRLDKAEVDAIELIAGCISDDRLRNKFIRLLVKDRSLEKSKKANNWRKCLSCEVLVAPGERYCTVCQMNKNGAIVPYGAIGAKNNAGIIEKLLFEAPWLTYDAVRKYIGCSLDEYNAAKKILARFYVKKIFTEEGGKVFQADLVMLLREIEPENLTQGCIDRVIGEVEKRLLKTGGGKYVFASGS